jgi:hypothetical protein
MNEPGDPSMTQEPNPDPAPPDVEDFRGEDGEIDWVAYSVEAAARQPEEGTD